jgi:DNA helicase II / ATP-dependent DNA helicase PcrA
VVNAEELLQGLDDEQRLAATTLHGPLAIIAGAGSGKTRVITHRIAYGVALGEHDPRASVAVAFTTKAAGEMTRRLRALGVPGVRVSTFHAAALRQLRYYWPSITHSELPELVSVKAPLVASAASLVRASTGSAAVRDFAAEIEWAKVHCYTPSAYADAVATAGRPLPADVSAAQMAELFEVYEQRKTSAGRMDFEDVLLLMAAVLEDHPRVVAHLRPALTHITVDEYQDISPLQQRVLDGWLGDNTNLCVVGDPAQTIYGFAGATSTHLTQFRHRYPDAAMVTLHRTYRCSPQIATAANRVLARSRTAVHLRSQRGEGPQVVVRAYSDAVAEAEAVAQRITALIQDSVPPSHIAVLVRINAMTEPFEDVFARRGIAFHVSGSSGFFARPEVRRALTLIRGAAVVPSSDTHVADAVSALLSGAGWSPEPPLSGGAVRTQWESLAALVEAAKRWSSDHPQGTMEQFAAELADRAERQDAPSGAGVTIASLHSAKGAEWQAVFLVGLNEGILPHSAATGEEDIAEEQRLLYVGVTRAADLLEISYHENSPSGRPRRPSRFLADISPVPPSTRPPRKSKRKSATCRVCGRVLVTGAEAALGRCGQCAGPVDPELFDQLRQWRQQTVALMAHDRGSSPPAYLVATDATLQAIAEQHPTDEAALARIPGIGPRKIADYGAAIVAIVRAHVTR